ncbi:MAG: TPM domain-containing protein, partial [Rhodothermales bacterium]
MKPPFTEEELERIRQAVAGAEGRTSGEIVPYLVPQSGLYSVATWRGASMAAVGVLLIALLVFQFY